LTLTRSKADPPEAPAVGSVNFSPRVGMVLQKVQNSDWKYSTRSFDTVASSKPLGFVRAELRVNLPNSGDHLKLWDLLDESSVAGPELLSSKALVVFAGSIYASDPVNQAGLCDYIEYRILPAVQLLVSRRDFAGVRQITEEANAWVDALKPDPTLAGNSPRLQWYINVFRRLDAVLDDVSFLYRHPAEVEKIIQHLVHTNKSSKGTVDFLRKAEDKELIAWADYLDASSDLSRFDYASAATKFGQVANTTGNRKLAELAALGQVRGLFWGATAGSIPKTEALQRIAEASRAASSRRFGRDIKFYTARLLAPVEDPASKEKEQ
jgi:hypothetical protein